MRKGFSLVELMITAALLAVVGAILAPNLIESQVRVKVARTRKDMHSLSMALEAYRTDNIDYPVGRDYYAGGTPLLRLTTPIAYLPTIPRSPFPGPIKRFNAYNEYTYARIPPSGVPRSRWVMLSAGPDLQYEINYTQPWFDPYGTPLKPWIAQSIYDPSNGVVSRGEIVLPSIQPRGQD